MRMIKHIMVGLLIVVLSLSTASISSADQIKSVETPNHQNVQPNHKLVTGVEAKTIKKHAKKKTIKKSVKKQIKKSIKKSVKKKTAKKSIKKKAVKSKKPKKAAKKKAIHKAVKKAPAKPARASAPQASAPQAPPAAQGQYNGTVEQQIVNLVNNVRSQNGLQPLQVKPELQNFARQWSQQQFSNGAMSHGMMNFSRNTIAGQNVAYAKGDVNYFGWDQIWSAQATMDGWMNSPGHRANILKPEYKYIGVGVVYGQKNGSTDGWAFFTQDFSD
ncbi:CAP domain-containing protein [Sporolactobacillus laevolacticus]|uniref:CAP domain-containing protein n=1 Tax=Sporolactobacillus laevolacticus TaxID=33018 RepID=UPI0025B3CC4D|nr:CAP domain-containing protein [Sporolactobacillus laevolacticus]MDN3956107.1 CAP domain-containing protein [Sporolactobacillus laevolacticus]